jgi:uncharacterized protein (TIGR03437 family)
MAANIIQYDDRAAFLADTSGRTVTDFETLRNACIAIPDAGGVTVNGVNLNGGVARLTSSGPCAPSLTPWQGFVLSTRLVIRADVPAQAFTTAALPAGTMAVAFDVGINSDPVNSHISMTVMTSDNKQQTFTVSGKGTGTGGARRVQPLFVGLTSSRPITAIQFRLPDIIDSNLILDNIITGQTAPPTVRISNGVVNGASFQATIAPNTWITIFGGLLSGASRPWGAEDFSGSRLPTSVEDVSVTINGKPAYVYYVSPGQVNVLTPPDLLEGPAIVEVSRGALKSSPVTVQAQRVAPGLFMFDPENRRYAAVTHVNGTLVGKTSLYPGATTPARPGEVITLWGSGFGRTTPDIPDGEVVGVPGRLIATPVVTIGGITADVQFAGLTGPGLYQINVKIPDAAPDGDVSVLVQVDGARSQDNAFVTVQH